MQTIANNRWCQFFILGIVIFTIIFPYLRIIVAGAPLYFLYFFQIALILYLRRSFRILPVIYVPILLIVFSFIFTLIINGGFTIERIYLLIQKTLCWYSIPAIYYSLKSREISTTFIQYAIIVSSCVVSVWGILQVLDIELMNDFTKFYYYYLAKFDLSKIIQGTIENGALEARAVAGLWNSNVYGPIITMTIPLILFNKEKYTFNVVALCLCMIGALASGSRQVFLVIMVIVFSNFLLNKENKKTNIYLVFGIIVIALIMIYTNTNIVDTLSRALGKKETGLEGGVMTRQDGYDSFFSVLSKYPLNLFLGYGIGYRITMNPNSLEFCFVSNSFLLILIQFGILGFVSFITIIWNIWVKCRNSLRQILICILIFGLTDNALDLSFIMQSMMCVLISFVLYNMNDK